MPDTQSNQPQIVRDQSLRELLRDGIAQLVCERVPSSALAAELLLMHALGRDRAWIYAHPEHEVDVETRKRYFSMIARRAGGIPTQHLTGHQEFWGLDFEVTPDVLIPRPETEHVIEVALECLRAQVGVGPTMAQHSARGNSSCEDRTRLDEPPQAEACATWREKTFRIADVGTGSGCIAIALAHELPAAQIVATDISLAALEVAHRNAARHGVASRTEFVQCNLLDFLRLGSPATSHGTQRFDLIASNPPYIGRREAHTLPREVREHEPDLALFAGETGTELYAPLIQQAAGLLKPGGYLVLELGYDSADSVMRELESTEWVNPSVRNDLAGIRRIACAQRCIERSSS